MSMGMEGIDAVVKKKRAPVTPKGESGKTGVEKAPRARKPKAEAIPANPTNAPETLPKYLEKGEERRKALVGRMSSAFSGINNKIIQGARFVLGAPEAVADKARSIYNGAKENIAGAYDGMLDGYRRGKQRTGERIQATKDKATRWGLGVAASVEDRAVSAWNIPQAWKLELGASRAGASAERSASRIEQLQQQLNAIQAEIIQLRGNQGGAVDRMWEKNLQAKERRERVGYAREALMGLEQRGIEQQKQAA